MLDIKNAKIAVIGLGYVGLPLAVEFGKHVKTIGFDINNTRVDELKDFIDHTLEVTEDEMRASTHFSVTDKVEDIKDCNVYIVTVPTPVTEYKTPDMTPVKAASRMLGQIVKKGDVIIYESTVYPGATEEEAIPEVESVSGLEFNKDFFAGYSPERINPGDKVNTVTKIMKVTAGSTEKVANFVDELYKLIITAGTHKASSIKVAEAAKVIENTQRDVNIALVNELALIFDRLNIDTRDVIEAAGTKWNFIKMFPGLVGGHCIGVDPYYLAHKAEQKGYYPQVILSGRRINEGMSAYVANKVIRLMNSKRIHVVDSRILVLGYTFKENCPDVRNTQVEKLVKEFEQHNATVDVFDPWANHEECLEEYGRELITEPEKKAYDAVIFAVGHDMFIEKFEKVELFAKSARVIFDVKGVLPVDKIDGRL
ncbi:nucleotide sugar dehydrogenase [Shewanella gaetbuli]|uniref:Nucleotide sugar dehydrogenase n=1 Tax=Shewanella gaetbuli TaxID=220752 RepID=A0A9X1ZM69_9GAMM|nr:nucleotide sugar dehydrogenase [Shewanella gaetbuli]MCL1142327.1 nucleotide sugar dehydrogenase [Shewanella gaetbuli]